MAYEKYFQEPINVEAFRNAKGEIPVRVCNDYLFRALMQEDNDALLSLIRAVVRFPEGTDITSAEITNPIVLGKSLTDKEYRLDIDAILNNHYRLNMEMQVKNEDDWPERSLSYLCRLFDSAKHGSTYLDIPPAIQISLLNYTLFPDHPKLSSAYRMMDIDDGKEYSDKFQLYVICLSETERATKRDKERQIDVWARFFGAKTWEELKMITKDNPIMEHAAGTIYQMAEEDAIREECEARERRIMFEESKRISRERLQKRYDDAMKALEEKTAEMNAALEEKDIALGEKDAMIREMQAQIDLLKKQMEDRKYDVI